MQLSLYLRQILAGVLLLSILFLTFWIRIQGAERLPSEQFTENDAYLYHWQANIIVEQGHLPIRDMHRWLPLGRDNGQLLSLYSYAIAYIHKAFPWLSLYDIQLYAPTLCFTLGLGVLLLFLTRCYGVFFATVVGVFLATLPGSADPNAAECLVLSLPMGTTLEEIEKSVILATLARENGNRSKTAAVLGISQPTLRSKLHAYDQEE